MPNYVKNIFIEIGQPNKFNKFTMNKDGIDFRILLPMPSTSLNLGDTVLTDTGSYLKDNDFTIHAIRAKSFSDFQDSIKRDLKLVVPKFNEQDELDSIADFKERNLVRKAYTTWNIVKLGYPSWYEWRMKHWGCKWNACHCEADYASIAKEYTFETAWTAPQYWLKELAKKVDFVLLYADEDIGSNCGIIEGVNGDLKIHNNTDYLDASTVFACIVNGCEIYNENEESDYYDKDEIERYKYLNQNRQMIFRDFFKYNGCLDIYERNKKVLQELVSY